MSPHQPRHNRTGIVIALLAFVFIVAASVRDASAQDPCATMIEQPVVSSAAMLKVVFCAYPTDQPDDAIVRVDGTAYAPQPISQLSAPNTQGLALYETTYFLRVARGNHTATIALRNRDDAGRVQEGVESSPHPFVAADPRSAPRAGSIKQITR